MKRNQLIFSSVIFLVMSACCIVYTCRAAVAYTMYFKAKFGSANQDAGGILNLCESASRFYGHNYNFCIWTAESAYYSSFKMNWNDAKEYIAEASRWCDAGLALNPYRSQLRRLKTCLIARSSPVEAVHYWERYVDWQYWAPANHALLVELYALAGDFDKAVDSLALIRGSDCYEEAAKRLSSEWKKETTLPQELSGKLSIQP